MPTNPDQGAVISVAQVAELLELIDRALRYDLRPTTGTYQQKLEWHSHQASEVGGIVAGGRHGNILVPWMVNRLRELLADREAAATAGPAQPVDVAGQGGR
jgi:hypothetical protein